ncbi:MAG: hypothetical protein KC486_01720 [Myxococcales bacterium]|nr:hypothetical protein [Myxococcales bacterium]
MEIEAGHVDRGSPLLGLCAAAFERRGAAVIVRDGDANWIRRMSTDEGGGFEVVVAGLPNLLHELAHAAQRGGLDDDHGFDYGKIPLRLDRPEHRADLWEEFAAAVVSCAYVDGSTAAIDAWFAEQIEIQGVFYGVGDDLDALWALLDAALRAHPEEAEGALDRAYEACEAWLREAGASEALSRPIRRFSAAYLWRRYSRGRRSKSL